MITREGVTTISKTASLRTLVTGLIRTLIPRVYYRRASNRADYPYAVFDFSRVDIGDPDLDIFDLCVDLWDRAESSSAIDDIADELEALLNRRNDPQDTILPTFFREARYPVDDPDKDIQHLQLTFMVELYTNT